MSGDIEDATELANVSKAWAKGKSKGDVINVYDEAADQYDRVFSNSAYTGYKVMSDRVCRLMGNRRDVAIIDIGAGSGLQAVELKEAGFETIDALDGSQGMLDIARTKDCYKNLFCKMMGTDLDIPKGSYDMAVCAGAFCEGHIPKTALRDMIHLVKPGGYIVNMMREPTPRLAYYGDGLEPYMALLESEGLWKLESKEVFPGYTVPGANDGVCFIHKIL